jgi:hypothetical protein
MAINNRPKKQKKPQQVSVIFKRLAVAFIAF